MKTVSGEIVSTKPVNLFKSADIMSKFVASDNGASQPVSAYLLRTSAAFNEHQKVKRKSMKPESKKRRRTE